jgi:hypothetical protein
MSDQASDMSLTAAFEAPAREAWLKLVDEVLKGGDFEKRLALRTADGLAIAPLATRADAGSAAECGFDCRLRSLPSATMVVSWSRPMCRCRFPLALPY